MKNLDHFVHCSTAYVNSYLGAGFINERIYEHEKFRDPEKFLKKLLSYTVEEIREK